MPDNRPRIIPSMIGMLHDVDVSTTLPSEGDTLVAGPDKIWRPGASGGITGAYDRFVVPATPAATFTLTFLPLAIFALAKNGLMLAQGYDYTVNYATGVVTLSTVPTTADVVTVSYATNGTTIALPSGGLFAWWRADTIGVADGTAVSLWTDFTSNHWGAAQSSAPSKPTFRAAPTGFNGQPAVQFSGGQELDLPYDAAFNLTGTTKMTVAIVMNHPNDGNTGFLVGMRDTSGGGSSGAGWILTKTFNNHVTGFGMDSGAAASPPSLWAVFDLDNTAPSEHGYLNGVLGQAGASSISGDPVNDPLRIGNDPNFGSPHGYTGYIAEIIMYDRVLSGIERGQLDNYIKAKYGL